MIFLDNNATTRPLTEVCTAVSEGMEYSWGNPSSIHTKGHQASNSIEEARNKVANFLGINPDSITFTSGATESNEAILRHFLTKGFHLVSSVGEHPAITGLYQKYFPERIHFIPYREGRGEWNLDALKNTLKALWMGGGNHPAVIALAWANGETGVIQEIEDICELAAKFRMPILVDATQIVGRTTIDFPWESGAYFTFSGHKLHSPKGVGVLVQTQSTPEKIIIQVGGGQESGIRGGTENVPGIIGLGVACEHRKNILPEAIGFLKKLRDSFEDILLKTLPNIRINGVESNRVPNTSNITFFGIDGMALVARLEAKDIMCSQVSACASGSPDPSKTLQAMGLSKEDSFSSVRFAFGIDNKCSEVSIATQVIINEVSNLRLIYS